VPVTERIEDLRGGLFADAGELLLEEAGDRIRFGRCQHLEQGTQFDPVRVGADLAGFGRELVGPTLELERFIEAGLPEFDPRVGVDDRGMFDVVVELLAGPHIGLHLQFDPRPVGPIPRRRLRGPNLRLVGVGVDDQLEILGLLFFLCSARDLRWLPACELRVEDGRRDTDPLLTAGLLAGVEP